MADTGPFTCCQKDRVNAKALPFWVCEEKRSMGFVMFFGVLRFLFWGNSNVTTLDVER